MGTTGANEVLPTPPSAYVRWYRAREFWTVIDAQQAEVSQLHDQLAVEFERIGRVREIVFQGGQDGESVRRALIDYLTITGDSCDDGEGG